MLVLRHRLGGAFNASNIGARSLVVSSRGHCMHALAALVLQHNPRSSMVAVRSGRRLWGEALAPPRPDALQANLYLYLPRPVCSQFLDWNCFRRPSCSSSLIAFPASKHEDLGFVSSSLSISIRISYPQVQRTRIGLIAKITLTWKGSRVVRTREWKGSRVLRTLPSIMRSHLL